MQLSSRFMTGEKLRCQFEYDFTKATQELNYDAVIRVVGASLSFLGIKWGEDVDIEHMLPVVRNHRFHGFVSGAESEHACKMLELALKSGMTIGEILSAYSGIVSTSAKYVVRAEREEMDKDREDDE